MKFSNIVPKYSHFIEFLKIVDGYSYSSLYNLVKKTENIDSDLYEGYSDFSFEKIKATCHLNENLSEQLRFFYSRTGSVPSKRDLLFAENHDLLAKLQGLDIGKSDSFFYYSLTEKGKKFVRRSIACLAEIDNKEMLLLALEDMAKFTECNDIDIGDYFPLCNTDPNRDFTQSRIDNLIDRGFLSQRYIKSQDYSVYKATQKGKNYLNQFFEMRQGVGFIEKYLFAKNDIEKLRMLEWLCEIDPYEFEHLIGLLLRKMGYYDIQVTNKSGDGGIDLVASLSSGTSTAKEIFQVKRWKNNIQRPTLDQMRGVLSISNAARGTLITISDFSKGCYNSFSHKDSVTLINGQELLNLMVKYKIGFTERKICQYIFQQPPTTVLHG
jgi:restriction system protein